MSAEQDTLTTPWSDYLQEGYVGFNPSYLKPLPFVQKAATENSMNVSGCVMRLPADTSVGWFKEAITTASEVRFITGGRIKFISPQDGKPKSANSKGSKFIIWHSWPRICVGLSTVELDVSMKYGQRGER